jgi:hypothetical protein
VKLLSAAECFRKEAAKFSDLAKNASNPFVRDYYLPYIFWNFGMQMLQQSDKITILYDEDHEIRHVRLNQPHPAQVAPSWYGDSVGHYEGETLVIDTVGIKTERPVAMVDWFGTPYTEALHVVERYRLLDYEAAKEGLERDAKENFQERERRAKIVAAEGEYQAAVKLGQAADIITEHPVALQLRTLQTMAEISIEKNSTIIFPAQFMTTVQDAVALMKKDSASK